MGGTAVSVPLQGGEEEFEDASVEPGDGGLHLAGRVEDQMESVLGEEVSDVGDGLAEFGGRGGVVGDGLKVCY